METETIKINDVEYVQKGKAGAAVKRDGMDYCIIRTYSAGVFAGYLEELDDKNAVVRDARRIWYWEGAASLSQLAVDGTNAPTKCKFPAAVDKIILTEVIEVLFCAEAARVSIERVPVWKK